MSDLRHHWRLWRWRFAVARYYLWTGSPYRIGDPTLGEGAERGRNRDVLIARQMRRAPKPEAFGLPRDTLW
jgi:hypothetical protein